VRKEKEYHIVEIMACPGGCVAGGGQPYPPDGMHVLDPALAALRAQALYSIDARKTLRKSQESADRKALRGVPGKPNGHRSHGSPYHPAGRNGMDTMNPHGIRCRNTSMTYTRNAWPESIRRAISSRLHGVRGIGYLSRENWTRFRSHEYSLNQGFRSASFYHVFSLSRRGGIPSPSVRGKRRALSARTDPGTAEGEFLVRRNTGRRRRRPFHLEAARLHRRLPLSALHGRGTAKVYGTWLSGGSCQKIPGGYPPPPPPPPPPPRGCRKSQRYG
jgi:hypothetical protein